MKLLDVKGQEKAAKKLSSFLAASRIPSALIFSGMDGVGKSLMATALAQALICKDKEGLQPCGLCPDCSSIARRIHPDVPFVNALYQATLEEEEISKQKTLKVGTIRRLRRDMEMESLLGSWKVAVIEDAHTLEVEAANALLKILEEPPKRTLWILLTSQKERIPSTVLSRCFTVRFSPLPPSVLGPILLERGLPKQQADLLGHLCEGSASRALQLAEGPAWEAKGGPPELAPLAAADSLPKELAAARKIVETTLYELAQRMRMKAVDGRIEFADVQRPLRQLIELRKSLNANADPKLVMILGLAEAKPFL